MEGKGVKIFTILILIMFVSVFASTVVAETVDSEDSLEKDCKWKQGELIQLDHTLSSENNVDVTVDISELETYESYSIEWKLFAADKEGHIVLTTETIGFSVDNESTPLEISINHEIVENNEDDCLFFRAVLLYKDDIKDRVGFKFSTDPASSVCDKEHTKHDEKHKGDGFGIRSVTKHLPGFTIPLSLLGFIGAAAFVANKRKLY